MKRLSCACCVWVCIKTQRNNLFDGTVTPSRWTQALIARTDRWGYTKHIFYPVRWAIWTKPLIDARNPSKKWKNHRRFWQKNPRSWPKHHHSRNPPRTCSTRLSRRVTTFRLPFRRHPLRRHRQTKKSSKECDGEVEIEKIDKIRLKNSYWADIYWVNWVF